jgi:hypothetical protein
MAPDTPPGPVPPRTAGTTTERGNAMARWVNYSSYSLFFDGADMTDDEVEFLLAVASYQKRFQRRYPTWLEVLNILRCLGYRKSAEAVPISEPVPPKADEPAAERSEYELMKAKFGVKKDEPP